MTDTTEHADTAVELDLLRRIRRELATIRHLLHLCHQALGTDNTTETTP